MNITNRFTPSPALALAAIAISTLAFAQGLPPDATPARGTPTVQPPVSPPTPSAIPDAEEGRDWSIKLTEIFATTEPVTVASGLKFAEGPLWWKDRLLVCDLGASIMYTLVPSDEGEAKLTEFRNPSDQAAGAALDDDGNLIAAHFAGHLSRTGTDGTVTKLADRMGEIKFGKCNDLIAHPSGVIFFTDFGGKESKGVFALAKDGTVSQVDPDFYAANGVAVSPDGKMLYAADYGNWIVKSYEVDADGKTSNRREIITLKGEKGRGRVDGLKVAPSGHILTTGPGGIWVLTADGKRHSRLPIAGGASNLALGGADGKTVFITSSDKVLSVKLK